MPNGACSIDTPESARLTQLQGEIVKRQLLNVFRKTGDHAVRDLSNEALLIEYITHLTDHRPGKWR